MSRPPKLLATSCAVFAVSILAGACGTEKIHVTKSAAAVNAGAVLFHQRCAGCHTLSFAAANGSTANVRTAEFNNGPNFNVRCERPVTRVLYAIQNGGFSGAIMPQNIVVGAQARAVAEFVATYAGRDAPRIPGSIQCQNKPLGTLPGPLATVAANAVNPAKTSTSPTKTTGKSKSKP